MFVIFLFCLLSFQFKIILMTLSKYVHTCPNMLKLVCLFFLPFVKFYLCVRTLLSGSCHLSCQLNLSKLVLIFRNWVKFAKTWSNLFCPNIFKLQVISCIQKQIKKVKFRFWLFKDKFSFFFSNNNFFSLCPLLILSTFNFVQF